MPLVSVRGDCLIDTQIKTIRDNYEESDILIVAGFLSSDVIEYVLSKYSNIRIVENNQYKNTSSLASLKAGINATLENDTFVIHGDRLFDAASLKINNGQSSILSHKTIKRNRNIGISFADSSLLNIEYGLPCVWSEMIFIAKKDYQYFKKMTNFSAKSKIYTIPDLIRRSSDKIKFSTVYDESIEIIQIKEIR
jgi:choline kinase